MQVDVTVPGVYQHHLPPLSLSAIGTLPAVPSLQALPSLGTGGTHPLFGEDELGSDA